MKRGSCSICRSIAFWQCASSLTYRSSTNSNSSLQILCVLFHGMESNSSIYNFVKKILLIVHFRRRNRSLLGSNFLHILVININCSLEEPIRHLLNSLFIWRSSLRHTGRLEDENSLFRWLKTTSYKPKWEQRALWRKIALSTCLTQHFRQDAHLRHAVVH